MILRILISALALLAGATCALAQAVEPELMGHWKVIKTVDAQESTSISSDDADKLVGKDMVITATRITFEAEACISPVFKRSQHPTSSFFRREYKMDPSKLRLPNPVVEVAVQCNQPSPISFIYIQGRRHIIFYWRGFFLRALKQTNTSAGVLPQDVR